MNCEGCNKCKPTMSGMHYNDKESWITCAQNEFDYSPELYNYPTAVLLGVTANCNLSCEYCFVHQKAEQMDYETALKAIQMVRKNAEYKQVTPTVIFFGGEPLLRFDDIIKPIVGQFPDTVFSLTTNGVLLDEDKVDFLYKHNVGILLSFDGVPEVQNSQRPAKKGNSFNQTARNIPYLLVRYPNISMRGTITKNSVPKLYESYLMAEEMGFKSTSFAINAFEEWDSSTIKEFEHQMNLIAVHILDGLMNITKNEFPCAFEIFNSDIEILRKLRYEELYFPNQLYRCGLGTSSFSVCPDGKIVPCQEKISNPTWIIGDVNSGIDQEKHKAFLRWYWDKINDLHCDRSCRDDIKAFCFARNICPSRLEDMDFKFSTSVCGSTKVMYTVVTRIFNLVDHSILPKFKFFFNIKDEEVIECK